MAFHDHEAEIVLVTGGSGFTGAHCILAALAKGYSVRTTVRSLTKAEVVRSALRHGGASTEQIAGVEIVAADLASDDGWIQACAGVTYVLAVASKTPKGNEKRDDDLVKPLVEGTQRLLRFAKAARVQRVVWTSSIAAVAHGHGKRGKARPFNENDWTDLSGVNENVHIYPKSKTLAEQAAWEYIRSTEGQGMELVTVCPVAILGPTLSKDYADSLKLLTVLLRDGVAGMPQYGTGMVDVRCLADLHVRAMASPRAAGQRYIAIAGKKGDEVCDFVQIKEAAQMLKDNLPAAETTKVPKRTLPNFVMRLAGWFDPVVGLTLPDLGKEQAASNAKARRELGWNSRSVEDAVVASAESLKKFGVI